MRTETLDTITRHLKGIMAALEKEKAGQTPMATKTPMVTTLDGKPLKDCTNEELLTGAQEYCKMNSGYHNPVIWRHVLEEIQSRGMALDLSAIGQQAALDEARAKNVRHTP